MIIVTGAAGFVGSFLIKQLKSSGTAVIGIDLRPSDTTDYVMDIANMDWHWLETGTPVSIIHCAAARFDYGLPAKKYFEANVTETEKFCESLQEVNVTHFTHLSSVAAIDGQVIPYTTKLGWDDAYRCTKYLQGNVVSEFCTKKNVSLVTVYPSAIYDDTGRVDTNIGKLVKFVNMFGFFPSVPVRKSITYLPAFSDFILWCNTNQVTGDVLCIEKPVRTVDQIIDAQAARNVIHIKVPGFEKMLMGIGTVMERLGTTFDFDPLLTRSRVVKLYKDTSYSQANILDGVLDLNQYEEVGVSKNAD